VEPTRPVPTPPAQVASSASADPQPIDPARIPTPPPRSLPSGAAAFAGNTFAGEVQSLDGFIVLFTDGTGFRINDRSTILRSQPGSRSDLRPGQYVGIDAVPQAEGTFLGATVTVFDEDLRGVAPGKRSSETGGVRINGTLEEVQPGELTVSYGDESARVRLAANTPALIQVRGGMDDVKVGSKLFAVVNNGIATGIIIQ